MDALRQMAGRRVRELRKAHLYVQAELAFRSGLHPRTLQRLEAGSGSFESFRSVAAALDVDARELFASEHVDQTDTLAVALERCGQRIIGTGTLSNGGGNFIIVAACKP